MLGDGLSHDMAVFDNSLTINKLALCGWVNFPTLRTAFD